MWKITLKLNAAEVDERHVTDMSPDRGDHTRHHVELPGGRRIEVVYLDTAGAREKTLWTAPREGATRVMPAPAAGEDSTTAREPELHVCPHCAGGLVHPLDWLQESRGRWRIALRCPDCGLEREGLFGEAHVERLDEELDRATRGMLSNLKDLTRANMSDEVELFARALELDLIGPSDFER